MPIQSTPIQSTPIQTTPVQTTPVQTTPVHAQCCIVGGGPAGLMLGLLLARQGVSVLVLEKHVDFLRDFRGDTVHPATLRVLEEIGLLDEFLALGPARLEQVVVETETGPVTLADFTRLPGRHRHIAFVPQWDFLNLLAGEAARHPSFGILRSAEAHDLLFDAGGSVVGVRAQTASGSLEIRADLTVAADGRHSVLRDKARLEVIAASPTIDVLWFRISRRPTDRVPFLKKAGRAVIVGIDRGEYWQIAYVIPKGSAELLEERGIGPLRRSVADLVPDLADRMDELESWDDVKLLGVRVDRLRRWYRSGLLAIGDAAHAMSPAGGVGINLAIQDAVAAANVLGPPLLRGTVTKRHLRRIQHRRAWPARVVQAFQLRALPELYPRADDSPPSRREPVAFRVIRRVPAARHLLGRFIGLGLRPEHVRTKPGTP